MFIELLAGISIGMIVGITITSVFFRLKSKLSISEKKIIELEKSISKKTVTNFIQQKQTISDYNQNIIIETEDETLYNGTIRVVKTGKGFGFITYDENKDIFFHFKSWTQPDIMPQEGMHVSFNIGEDNQKEGKLAAVNLKSIDV